MAVHPIIEELWGSVRAEWQELDARFALLRDVMNDGDTDLARDHAESVATALSELKDKVLALAEELELNV